MQSPKSNVSLCPAQLGSRASLRNTDVNMVRQNRSQKCIPSFAETSRGPGKQRFDSLMEYGKSKSSRSDSKTLPENFNDTSKMYSRDLRAFLGATIIFKDNLRQYAHIMQPMDNCTGKHTQPGCNPYHRRVTFSPLRHPNATQPVSEP